MKNFTEAQVKALIKSAVENTLRLEGSTTSTDYINDLLGVVAPNTFNTEKTLEEKKTILFTKHFM